MIVLGFPCCKEMSAESCLHGKCHGNFPDKYPPLSLKVSIVYWLHTIIHHKAILGQLHIWLYITVTI